MIRRGLFLIASFWMSAPFVVSASASMVGKTCSPQEVREAKPITCRESLLREYESYKAKLRSIADVFWNYGFLGLYGEIDDLLTGRYAVTPSSDAEALRLIDEMGTYVVAYNTYSIGYVDRFNVLRNQLQQMDDLLRHTAFPGYETLKKVRNDFVEFMDNGKAAGIEETIERLRKAIRAYKLSVTQNADASIDNPADFTSLVLCPDFKSVEGKYTVDGWKQFDGTNTFMRMDVCGTSCAGISAYRDVERVFVEQTLSGIPNGYYRFSADMVAMMKGMITDQHLYATTRDGEVVSPILTSDEPVLTSKKVEGLERLETGLIAVSDGELTIGAAGSPDLEHVPNDFPYMSAMHYRGSFFLGNVQLMYCGALDASECKIACEKLRVKAQLMCDTMMFKGDRKRLQAVIDEYKTLPDGLEELEAAYDFMDAAFSRAANSVAIQDSLLGGDYQELVRYAEAEVESELPALSDIAKKTLELVSGLIYADDASCSELSALLPVLRAYVVDYLPVLRKACTSKIKHAEAREPLTSLLNENITYLTSCAVLPSATALRLRAEQLTEMMVECSKADFYFSGNKDYTSFIVNADMSEGEEGWTFERNYGDGKRILNGQAWDDVKSNKYMEFVGRDLNFSVFQTIKDIPNGVYRLGVKGRAGRDENGNANTGNYLFAVPDGDNDAAVFAPMKSMPVNLTELEGYELPGGGVRIEYSFRKYGTIWEEAARRIINGESKYGSLDDRISESNGGWGYGWNNYSLTVEVKNHEVKIGITCDSLFTEGRKDTEGEDCIGSWAHFFSADDFTLTLLETGDNTGWPLVTGIDAVECKETENGCRVLSVEYFSLSGMKSVRPHKGVNIVRRRMSDGSVRTEKVYIR